MARPTRTIAPGRAGACGACVFWDPRNAHSGLCRAAAPRTHAVGQGDDDIAVRALWPLTGVEDWCGQWRPADAAQ